MLTLKDIATHVGVSVSTVSLVLNDRDHGRVKPHIAQQIRLVADEMGYVPNLLARGLKTRQTHTIGLLSDHVASTPFAGQMLAGAQTAAWEEGYLLLLIDTAGNRELEPPAVKSLLQRNIEALIFAAEFHSDVSLPLVPSSIPTVVLDGKPRHEETKADWVVPDETGGAYNAVRHLIDAGHRRIGFCNVSNSKFIASPLRRAGYEAALTEAGLEVDPSLIVYADEPSTPASLEPARDLLNRPDRPTAVFCFGDKIAFGFYQVANALGLEVPSDLSIVGFDNQQFLAEALVPGLTTIQLPHRDMGIWAARQAIARIRGEEPQEDPVHRYMPCPLLVRNSVATMSDREAAEAHPLPRSPGGSGPPMSNDRPRHGDWADTKPT